MNDESYQPIACADYDIYEIAIMRKSELHIEWVSSQGELQRQRVRPMELKIVDGAEYLFFKQAEQVVGEKQQVLKVRLDRIKHTQMLDNH